MGDYVFLLEFWVLVVNFGGVWIVFKVVSGSYDMVLSLEVVCFVYGFFFFGFVVFDSKVGFFVVEIVLV